MLHGVFQFEKMESMPTSMLVHVEKTFLEFIAIFFLYTIAGVLVMKFSSQRNQSFILYVLVHTKVNYVVENVQRSYVYNANTTDLFSFVLVNYW